MINMTLAIAAGIIGVVTIVYALIRESKKAKQEDKSDIDTFLNLLDDTRESRYNDRSRMLRQFDGFRHEWYAYEDAYAPNFSMD